MSELFDKEVNAQKKSLKKTSEVHASSHKPTKKCAMEMKETNKENNAHVRYRPEVTSHSLAYFCRVASSTRWCLESTYFSIILTWRNCNGYMRVVLAIVQAKTNFVGDLHHYISSLLNT